MNLRHFIQHCLFVSCFFFQQKLKEEREAKRGSLDARHQHVFGAIATKLDMEDSAVEEFMLEGAQVSCSVQAPPGTI